MSSGACPACSNWSCSWWYCTETVSDEVDGTLVHLDGIESVDECKFIWIVFQFKIAATGVQLAAVCQIGSFLQMGAWVACKVPPQLVMQSTAPWMLSAYLNHITLAMATVTALMASQLPLRLQYMLMTPQLHEWSVPSSSSPLHARCSRVLLVPAYKIFLLSNTLSRTMTVADSKMWQFWLCPKASMGLHIPLTQSALQLLSLPPLAWTLSSYWLQAVAGFYSFLYNMQKFSVIPQNFLIGTRIHK